jgi:hypothetical protein
MSLAFSPPLSSTAREGDEDDSTLNSTAFHLKPFNVRESTPIGKKSGLQPRACCGSSSRALTTRENRNNRRSVNSTEGDEDEYGTAFRLKPFDVRQSTPVGKKSGNRDDCGLHPSRRRACCGSSSRAITIRENRNNRREAPRYDPPQQTIYVMDNIKKAKWLKIAKGGRLQKASCNILHYSWFLFCSWSLFTFGCSSLP